VSKPVTGIFSNGMAYARWGRGPKTLLLIPGGPGNLLPSRMRMPMYQSLTRLLVRDGYTAWLVTRKQGMPEGHRIADMADDYAGLIRDEFGGRVDAVVGISTGGLIGFPLAARHRACLGRIAILAAAYAATGPAAEADIVYARLLAEGRTAAAISAMTGYAFPRMRRFGIARVLGTLMGPFAFRGAHPAFRRDTVIEAEAEVGFDARAWLPDIRVPVLLVAGGADQFFTREAVEETARLIPGSSLRIYEGRDHVGALQDERLPSDVLELVTGSVVPAPGEPASEAPPEPVVAEA
jgi:pimeloyl-ACP methyl ester carboxylesterase